MMVVLRGRLFCSRFGTDEIYSWMACGCAAFEFGESIKYG